MKKSVLCYFGGKTRIRKQIIEKFPPHECYIEPFVGGGLIFFFKKPSKFEIINDKDDNLICLYEVMKTAPLEFVSMLQYELYSRRKFERYKGELYESDIELTKMEKALRIFYLLKSSYGGILRNASFKIMTSVKPTLIAKDIKEIMIKASERLRTTIIESLDFRELVMRYDRDYSFFYLDPPYHCKGGKSYINTFSDKDFIDLSNILRNIKGKFLLSLNDDQFIRELFGNFNIEKIPIVYSVNRGNKGKRVTELLISNY